MARILLIDDDDSLRAMLGIYLARAGHTVIQAHDGQEGLELFPATAADLVITDMMMPKKDGLEVLRALRDNQPPVKIIAMSGGMPTAIGRCTGTSSRWGRPPARWARSGYSPSRLPATC